MGPHWRRAPALLRLAALAGITVAVLLTATGSRLLDWVRQSNVGWAHPLAGYPEATCLDGSPGLYYLSPGSGDGRSKFLVFFEGGGFCASHEDCASRAREPLGSTRRDAASMALDHPFFARSRSSSPLLWNWNHVFVRYCDGAYFSGYRREPHEVGGSSVFYRGLRISEAVFSDLGRFHGLRNATDVVLSGCSAGAIRVFAHADAVRAMLPTASARVTGFPDSGFYLDRDMFTPLKRFAIVGQNATELLSRRCLDDNRGAEERCLIGAVAAPYLRTPVFAWQSRYDTDQRTCEMSPACAADASCVRAYGDDLSSQLWTHMLSDARHGAFLDSCDRHCEAWRLPHDDVSRLTPTQAFAEWYAGNGRFYSQGAKYPCPSCCGALMQFV